MARRPRPGAERSDGRPGTATSIAGSEDFCVLTIGSGVGHKVFIDGRPQLGAGGRGGEIGHLRVDPGAEALTCDCGERGHLGGIASGRGTERMLRARAARDPEGFRASALGAAVDAPSAIDGPAVADAFARSDPWVRSAIAIGLAHLGHGIAAIHLAVGIERFILVGGFAFAMGEPYRRMLVRCGGGRLLADRPGLGRDDRIRHPRRRPGDDRSRARRPPRGRMDPPSSAS